MCNAYNHPPGCTCGWGGEGHAGRSDGGWSYAPPINHWAAVTREWRERDFTRPTQCPECGKDVFFIRHNGGSVWADELGWPWPIHPCFDKPGEPTHRVTLHDVKGLRLHQPRLAVIRGISGNGTYDEPTVEIQFTDSPGATLVLRSTPPDFSIVGSLVVISEADRLLVHPQYGEISFHSFTHLPTADSATWHTRQQPEPPPATPTQEPLWRLRQRSRLL